MSIQVYNGLALYPIAADLGELQTLGILPRPGLKGEKITPKNRSFADTRETRALCFRVRDFCSNCGSSIRSPLHPSSAEKQNPRFMLLQRENVRWRRIYEKDERIDERVLILRENEK